MPQYPSVILKRGKEESLRRFHPWIFSGAIMRMDEGIGEGDIVNVFLHRAISSPVATIR